MRLKRIVSIIMVLTLLAAMTPTIVADEEEMLKYEIHYFYDGVEDISRCDTLYAQAPLHVVREVPPKDKDGYKLANVPYDPPLPATITSLADDDDIDVINVYYVIDEDATLNYEVRYFYADEEDISLREYNKVHVLTPEVKSVKLYPKLGYRLADVPYDPPLPATISSLTKVDVINVHYVIDENATLDYEIRYFYNDEEETELRIQQTVHVLTPEVSEVPLQPKLGYKLSDEPYNPPLPATVSSLGDDDIYVINVHYVTDESALLNYEVRYFYDDIEDITRRTMLSVHVLTPVVSSVPLQPKPGYKLAENPYSPNLPATITSLTSPDVINVYYVIDDEAMLDYEVHYFYNDDEDITLRTVLSVHELTPEISSVPLQPKYGYKLADDPYSPKLPATITSLNGIDVINVRYVTDDSIRLNYGVRYFYNGIEDPKLQTPLSVQVLTPDVNNVPLQPKDGYKLADTPYTPVLPTTITAKNNEINVYYVTDETVRLSYEVRYFYNGVENENLRMPLSVQFLTPIVNSVPLQPILGYKLADVPYDPLLPATITSLNNKINVYYVTDESVRLSYEVRYFYNRVEDKSLRTTLSVQVLSPKVSSVPVQPREDYHLPDEEYAYAPALPTTITAENKVINVYYVLDDAVRLDYEVHYFYNNKENEDLLTTLSVHKQAPVISKVPRQPIYGYKLADTPYDPTLPATITSLKKDINVYYVTDETVRLNYEVHYVYNNIEDTTLRTSLSVQVLTPEVSSVPDKPKLGYKFSDAPCDPALPTVITTENNVITVYYVTDESIRLNYKVRYFYNGIEDTSIQTTLSVQVLTPVINSVPEQPRLGYKLTEAPYDPTLPTAITTENNVINVYYVTDESVRLEYEVRYFYNTVENTTLRIKQSVQVLTPVVSSVPPQPQYGYKLDDIPYNPPLPATITSLDGKIDVINVYYVTDESVRLSYEVRYFYNRVEDKSLRTALSVQVLTPEVSSVPVQPREDYHLPDEEYAYDPALPTTITAENKVINVYYVLDDAVRLDYEVHYFYNNMEKECLRTTLSVHKQAPVISEVPSKPIYGYKLADEPYDPSLPATITSLNGLDVISVRYVTDETVRLDYEVHYFYNNIEDTTLRTSLSVQVLAPEISIIPEQPKLDYEFSKTDPTLPTVITEDNRVINVYYVTDNSGDGDGGGDGDRDGDSGGGSVSGGGGFGPDTGIEDTESPTTYIEEPEPTTLDFLEMNEHRVYIQGYPDNTVQPDHSITRAEMATIFYRLLKEAYQQGDAEPTFSDVPKDAWYSLAIATLAELGIITGYEDGTFQPNKPITRAEFAVVASRFAKLSTTRSIAFSDVPADHWAAKDIASAFARGWINGYSDGTYLPNKLITRAEVSKIINIMLKRLPEELPDDFLNPFDDISVKHWAYIHIMEASTHHEFDRDENDKEFWTIYTSPVLDEKLWKIPLPDINETEPNGEIESEDENETEAEDENANHTGNTGE